MAITYTNKFLVQMMKMLLDSPCLWKETDPRFKNRYERAAAIRRILVLFRSVNPNATEDTVQKRILNMRSSFRKEFKKKKNAMKRGEVYEPGLWYYGLLKFLEKNKDEDCNYDTSALDKLIAEYGEFHPDNTEGLFFEIDDSEFSNMTVANHDSSTPPINENKRPRMDEGDSDVTLESEEIPEETDEFPAMEASLVTATSTYQEFSSPQAVQASSTHAQPPQAIQAPSTYAPVQAPSSSNANRAPRAFFMPQASSATRPISTHEPPESMYQTKKLDEILKLVTNLANKKTPEAVVTAEKAKMFASFGEYVSGKLCHLPSEMVPICQKLISDAIFYAETGNLDVTSRIATDVCNGGPKIVSLRSLASEVQQGGRESVGQDILNPHFRNFMDKYQFG